MFEEAQEFRQTASLRGLISETKIDGVKQLYFADLNQGQFHVVADPSKVLEVIKIAREIAGTEGSGEHNAMLHSAFYRPTLETSTEEVAYCFFGDKTHGPVITVQDWLASKGHPYIPNWDD